METIDLTAGYDLKRIAQSWGNLSTEHSIDRGSTLLFADRFGIELPLWNERRLKLFIVGCDPLIRFPMKAVPTDPEEVYQALLRQTQGESAPKRLASSIATQSKPHPFLHTSFGRFTRTYRISPRRRELL
jgi:hypothetical protein